MNPATVFGLMGCTLLPAAFLPHALGARRHRPALRSALFVGGVVLAWIPVNGLPISGYLRGLTGDFSVTTWVLLAAWCASNLFDRDFYHPGSFLILSVLVLAGGLVLYPLALGLTYFDPYALGYDSRAFLAVLFSLAVWAAYRDHYLVAVCLTLAVFGYSIELLESRNLWDYLLDPWLTLYAGYSAARGLKSSKG